MNSKHENVFITYQLHGNKTKLARGLKEEIQNNRNKLYRKDVIQM